MNNKTSTKKISIGAILSGIFFLLLFISMFFTEFVFEILASEPEELSESRRASKSVAEALVSLNKVDLDISILRSDYFNNIIILPVFPTDSKTLANFGKTNPFLGSFTAESSSATEDDETVGGVIYSGQRSVNDGNSVVPVQGGRGLAPQGRR